MSRTSNLKNLAVFFLTLPVVAVPLLVFLAPNATDESNLGLALRISARLAFLLYVVVFVSRPLQQLVPAPFTHSMLRNRRYIGITFAAVMTVHLALISWLLLFVTDQGRSLTSLVPGMVTYAFVFLMLLTSFDAPAQALGSKSWRRLHKTGLYWIGGVFAVTLLPDFIDKPSNMTYRAIGILMIFGVTVRIAAFVKRKYQSTAAIESAR